MPELDPAWDMTLPDAAKRLNVEQNLVVGLMYVGDLRYVAVESSVWMLSEEVEAFAKELSDSPDLWITEAEERRTYERLKVKFEGKGNA
jgi:hypothetical protein